MTEAPDPARDRPGPGAGGPWPASAAEGPSGLELGGVACADLAARFGTPLIVFDEREVRARCRAIVGRSDRVLYAVKAFTAHAMIRIALEEGLDLLASTGGEVEACLRAGARGDRIVLHGNNKDDAELALAVEAGLSLVIADGADELERLDRIAREAGCVQPVLLRVVPEVRVATHESIATGHEASKFGTPRSEAVAVVERARSHEGLRLEGLHAHIGSQVPDVASYVEALDTLLAVAFELEERGIAVRVLDLGGGYAVPYVDEPGLEPAEVAGALRARLADRWAGRDSAPPALVAEPGRALVANAAVTLYRVGAKKVAGGRTLVAVDGGMSDNLRPMLYDARFVARVAGRPAPPGPAAPVTIVGKHCESGDVLAEDVPLPADVGAGDLLAVAATGAYTYSLSTPYNRVGRPAVVAVVDGAAVLWLRREDAGDLDRLEAAASGRLRPATPPPDGVSIRPARPRDAASFVDLWRSVVEEGRYVRSETVAHPTREYRSRFRRSWTEREAQIVAVEGDRVVGHLYVQREAHPVTRHVATLGISVAPDRRGRGIGAALLAEALRWAEGVGVEKIVLSVYPHNVAAISLYRRFGFVEEGRLTRQSHKATGYEDEILMGLWLGA